jgi:hypothetical protein
MTTLEGSIHVTFVFSPNSSEILTVPNMKILAARHGRMQFHMFFKLVYAYFNGGISSCIRPHTVSAQGL